jgi:flagellar protein FlaI
LVEAVGWAVRDEGAYKVPAMPGLSEKEERLLSALTKQFLEGASEKQSDLEGLLREICDRNNLLLGKDSAKKILEIASRNINGFGVLDYLLADDALEEISVVGVKKPIYVFHRSKGWLETNCSITSEEFAVNVINKMARPLGRRVAFQSPRLNATLPDGSRLHASISPVNLDGVEITIRKFKQKPFSMPELVSNSTFSFEAAAFLWTVLYGDVSLLIAGNTGSGKTTTLNALFSFIPLSDRIVITEDTPELNVPHEHKVRIVANEELGIKMSDLVKDTLRMRPDRVIIGEVRSQEEVSALMDSLLSGQARGSYCTFHADSAAEALYRLKALGANEEDLNALDLVLVQKRITSYDSKAKRQLELRRVTEIAEVREGKPIVLFKRSQDKLEKTQAFSQSEVLRKAAVSYSMGIRELLGELQKRKAFLEKLGNLSHADFTNRVQAYLFG